MVTLQVLPYPTSGPGVQTSALLKGPQEAEEPEYAWVPGLVDAATVEALEKIGSQWGNLTGLPFGAPIPLLLLTGLCTVIHRYNPNLPGFPVGVSFGWYILQADEEFEEEEYSRVGAVQHQDVDIGRRPGPKPGAGGSSVGTVGWASESENEVSNSEDEFAQTRDPEIFESLRASLAVQLQQQQKFQQEQMRKQMEAQPRDSDDEEIHKGKNDQSDVSGGDSPISKVVEVAKPEAGRSRTKEGYDSDDTLSGLAAFHKAAATAAGIRQPPTRAALQAAVAASTGPKLPGGLSALKRVITAGASGSNHPNAGAAAGAATGAAAGAAAGAVAGAAAEINGEAKAPEKKKPSGWAKLWRLYDAPPSGQDVKLNWQANGLFAEAISDALSSISMSTVTEDEDADQLLSLHVEMDNLPLRSTQQPSKDASFSRANLPIAGDGTSAGAAEGSPGKPADKPALAVEQSPRPLSRTGSFCTGDGIPKPRRGLPKDATLLEVLAHVGAKLFEAVGSAEDGRAGVSSKKGGGSGKPLLYGSNSTRFLGFGTPSSRTGSMRYAADDAKSGRSAASARLRLMAAGGAGNYAAFFKYFAYGIDRATIEEEGEDIPDCPLAGLFVPGSKKKAVIVRWRYDKNVYEEAAVVRFHQNFCFLMQKIASLPAIETIPLHYLPVLADEEREKLEDSFSGRLVPHALWHEEYEERKRSTEAGDGKRKGRRGKKGPDAGKDEGADDGALKAGFDALVDVPGGGKHRDRTLSEMIARRAFSTPDSPAVYDQSGEKVTYGQLIDKALMVAQLLDKKLEPPRGGDAHKWSRIGEAMKRTAGGKSGPGAASPRPPTGDGGLDTPTERNAETRGKTEVQVIGLGFERSTDWIAALLGVLLSGRAYVPFDLSPESKSLFVDAVDDTAMRIILTSASTKEAYQGLAVELGKVDKRKKGRLSVFSLDDVKQMVKGDGNASEQEGASDRDQERREKILTALLPRVKGSSVSCVLYTPSANSGRPTGIIIQHHAVINLAQAFRRLLPNSQAPADVRAMLAQPSNPNHILELFAALDVGVPLGIVPLPPEVASGENGYQGGELERALPGYAQGLSICGLSTTPSLAASLEPRMLPSVKWVMFGGEPVPRSLVWRWVRAGRMVVELFGCTECLGAAVRSVWRPGDRVVDAIGTPVPGVHVYILGPNLEMLPMGAIGEICIAGVQLAKSYVRKKSATEDPFNASFVPNPYSLGSHDRKLFRTKERGRWLPNGLLQYLGPEDAQVRIRGLSVETAFVEAAINRVDGVERALVVYHTQHPGRHPYLAAYVLPKSTAGEALLAPSRHAKSKGDKDRERFAHEELVRAVRDVLEASLPAHFIPSAMVVMKRLALDHAGLADKTRLQLPPAESFYVPKDDKEKGAGAGARMKAGLGPAEWDQEEEPLETLEEQAVAVIFAEVLPGVDPGRLQRSSNFFALGGTSFSAVKAVSRLNSSLGAETTAKGVANSGLSLSSSSKSLRGAKAQEPQGQTQVNEPHMTLVQFFQDPTVLGVAEAMQLLKEERTPLKAGDHSGLDIGDDERCTGTPPASRESVRSRVESKAALGPLAADGSKYVPYPPLVLASEASPAAADGAPPARPGPPVQLPLSTSQQVAWVAYHTVLHPASLDHCDVWRLQGPVNAARLEAALHRVLAKHSALRMQFFVRQGGRQNKSLQVKVATMHKALDAMQNESARRGGSAGLRGRSFGPWESLWGNPRPKAVGVQNGGQPQAGGLMVRALASVRAPQFWSNLDSVLECVSQAVVPMEQFPVGLSVVDASETRNRKRAIADAIAQARRPFALQNTVSDDALTAPPASQGKSGKFFLGRGRSTMPAGKLESEQVSVAGLVLPVGEPLFRTVLIKLNPTENYLVFVFSTMIFDGISSPAFYSDLMEAYAAGAAPTGAQELAKGPTFADVVAWEKELAQRREVDLAYWARLLKPFVSPASSGPGAGAASPMQPQRSLASFSQAILTPASMAPIPRSALGKAVRTLTSGAYVTVTIPATLRRHLETAAHQHQATLFMVLQAAFHSLLHLWSLHPVVAVAVPVARRPILGLQGVVGRLGDALPIVTDTSCLMDLGPVPFCGLISVPKVDPLAMPASIPPSVVTSRCASEAVSPMASPPRANAHRSVSELGTPEAAFRTPTTVSFTDIEPAALPAPVAKGSPGEGVGEGRAGVGGNISAPGSRPQSAFGLSAEEKAEAAARPLSAAGPAAKEQEVPNPGSMDPAQASPTPAVAEEQSVVGRSSADGNGLGEKGKHPVNKVQSSLSAGTPRVVSHEGASLSVASQAESQPPVAKEGTPQRGKEEARVNKAAAAEQTQGAQRRLSDDSAHSDQRQRQPFLLQQQPRVVKEVLFDRILAQVRERDLEAMEHSTVTMQMINAKLRPGVPDPFRMPFVPAFFSLTQPGIDAPPGLLPLEDSLVGDYDVETSGSRVGEVSLYPISLLLRSMRDGRISGRLIFQDSQFERKFISIMAEEYERLLQAVLEPGPLALQDHAMRWVRAYGVERSRDMALLGNACLPQCIKIGNNEADIMAVDSIAEDDFQGN